MLSMSLHDLGVSCKPVRIVRDGDVLKSVLDVLRLHGGGVYKWIMGVYRYIFILHCCCHYDENVLFTTPTFCFELTLVLAVVNAAGELVGNFSPFGIHRNTNCKNILLYDILYFWGSEFLSRFSGPISGKCTTYQCHYSRLSQTVFATLIKCMCFIEILIALRLMLKLRHLFVLK